MSRRQRTGGATLPSRRAQRTLITRSKRGIGPPETVQTRCRRSGAERPPRVPERRAPAMAVGSAMSGRVGAFRSGGEPARRRRSQRRRRWLLRRRQAGRSTLAASFGETKPPGGRAARPLAKRSLPAAARGVFQRNEAPRPWHGASSGQGTRAARRRSRCFQVCRRVGRLNQSGAFGVQASRASRPERCLRCASRFDVSTQVVPRVCK